jgi:hypothetical protein
LHECRGYIDTIVAVGGVSDAFRVAGWAFDETAGHVPQEIFLLDANDKVVGVGMTGLPRADVAQVINREANFSGFDGYILGDANNIRLVCANWAG